MVVLRSLRAYALIGLLFCISLVTVLFIPHPSNALPPSASSSSPSFLTENVQRTTLPNGLTVITKEIHTAPVVSVHLWYQVGSRNEPAGENGISHVLEHLLFKGTVDRPIQFGRLFNALGSRTNAFTSYDITGYYNTVEQDKLEAILELEADRMIHARIDADALESEKQVVISELQGNENYPGYRLTRAVMKAAFPDHPYGLLVIGTKADVESFTVEQVQRYYQKYYTPQNATLVITGDFNTDALLEKVQTIFGGIENRSGDVPAPGVSPTATAPVESPIILREPGSSPLVQVIYPLVDINHPDVPALDLMDTILATGRSSRLYQALVKTGLASDAIAYPMNWMIEPGWYDISITATQSQSPEVVEQALLETLDELRQQEVTSEELERAKIQLKTRLALRNQDVDSQADVFAHWQTVAGDYRYGDRYLAGIERVTPADIQRVAQIYLDPQKRTVGYFEPTTVDASESSSNNLTNTSESFDSGPPVDPAEVAQYLPAFDETVDSSSQASPEKFTLDNGLEVLLLPDFSTPIINLSGWIDAGGNLDKANMAGLASLTASTLLSGTQTQDDLALAKTLEDQGAELEFYSFSEGVSIDGYVLNENLDTLVQTLADVLQHATFPESQLEVERQRSLTRLKEDMDDPWSLSHRLFYQAVYPEGHPLHLVETPESLTAITRKDVMDFYAAHYRPDTTVLSVVGGFDPDELKARLTDALGTWKVDGERSTVEYPTTVIASAQTRLNQVLPGKTEAVTMMGYDSDLTRQDSRYYAAQVLNQILGGGTLSSRLGTEIRDRQGLTYGIYSFFDAGIHSGPFMIYMQTSPENTEQAIQSTIALLKQLQVEGVTDAEIATAKRSLANGYSVDLSNPIYLASMILSNEIHGLDLDEIRNYPARIEAVTAEQVQQIIPDLIHPDRLVIVTSGPA